MVNYTLKGCGDVHVQIAGSPDTFHSLTSKLGFLIDKGIVQMPSGNKIITHSVESIDQVLEEFPRDYDRAKLRFPLDIGKKCDEWDINWTEKINRLPRPEKEGIFFDTKRRDIGRNMINKMLECGAKAGIRDRMFLAFGNCLGYALTGDFLPTDSDIDMCIHSDGLTQEQLHKYLMECKSAGLTEDRLRGPFTINGKYVWFSIGDKSIDEEHGVKSCNWFWFNFGGFSWHSKGKKWIGRRGLDDKYPTAKGIPENLTNELKTVKFGGTVEIQVPKKLGECLDWWYPGWLIRKKESSAINTVLTIPDEKNKSSWFIVRK
jgi:hypothetical protein